MCSTPFELCSKTLQQLMAELPAWRCHMEQIVLWDSLALHMSSSKAGIIWPHLLSDADQTHPDSDLDITAGLSFHVFPAWLPACCFHPSTEIQIGSAGSWI